MNRVPARGTLALFGHYTHVWGKTTNFDIQSNSLNIFFIVRDSNHEFLLTRVFVETLTINFEYFELILFKLNNYSEYQLTESDSS